MTKQSEKKKDKITLLDESIQNIEKVWGKGAVMRIGDKPKVNIPAISTCSIGLDKALGVGGIPRGRISEIFGNESSGKTSLATHIIAQAQQSGGIAAMVDAEHAFDPEYARKLGADVDNLRISQPGSGEEALEIVDHLVRSTAVDIVVVDSVAALTPKAELEGEMGDSRMGLQARLMSQAMRKLAANVANTKTSLIFINQTREVIGGMYGPQKTTSGGNALKFYTSTRLDIRKIGQIKDGEEVVGHRTRVKVVKNKVAPPFKKAEFDIIYGEGISKTGEIIDYGVEMGILKQSGSWYSYGDTKLGQGRENVRSLLKDNIELSEELEKKIKEKL
jgi:recombination protein RecA